MTQDDISVIKESGLLNPFKDNMYVTLDKAAILILNQILYNETLSDVGTDIDSHKFIEMFRNINVAIATRVLHLMLTPELVAFVPVTDPLQPVARQPIKTILQDLDSTKAFHKDIDIEASYASHLAHSIALEIDQHVISDLRSSAGTVAYVDPSHPDTDFRTFYKHIVDVMSSKCSRFPNWIVASSDVCKLVQKETDDFTPATDDDEMPLGIRYLGIIKWLHKGEIMVTHHQKLFENTFAPEDELLTGYRGNDDEPTYEFRPKILLEALPEKNNSAIVRKARLQSEFDIHWPDHGGNFYARINVRAPD